MTVSPYIPASMVTGAGWKARLNRARAEIQKARDPQTLLVRRIRQYGANLDGAEQRARDDHRAEHTPVASPVPQAVHQQVRDLLDRFIAEHGLVGRDLTLPLVMTGETLEAKIERYRAEAEAQHQRTVADLQAAERDIALAKVHAAQAALLAIETRGTVPGEVIVVDEPVPVAEAETQKRGRGRPPGPRISHDPAADPVPMD